MAVTQKVTLYNNKFTVSPVINAVQNDTDRQVEAYFGDFTLQVGMTGKLSFIRSDGTHYEVSATLNTGANTATAELDQALTQAGVTQAQLKITDSGNVGSTFTFMIKVQPDVAGISQQQDGYSAEELAQGIADNASAIANIENVELPKKADSDGNYENMTVGTADSVLGTPTTESVPYLFRRSASIGVRESDKIIGGTVAWNQLVQNGNFADGTNEWAKSDASTWSVANNVLSYTANVRYGNCVQRIKRGNDYITDNGKYLFTFTAKSYTNNNTVVRFRMYSTSTTYSDIETVLTTTETKYTIIANVSNVVQIAVVLQDNNSADWSVINLKNVTLHNLTQALGSAIADYIYGLETATAGSGIAKLKEWGFLTKDYYAYDSGSLQSVKTSAHKTVGKNLCPNNGWVVGQYNPNDIFEGGALSRKTSPFIPIFPNTDYTMTIDLDNLKDLAWINYAYFDESYTWLGNRTTNGQSAFTGQKTVMFNISNANARYIRLTVRAYSDISKIISSIDMTTVEVQLEHGSQATAYEQYGHVYPLDSSLDLRGLPKLDGSNKLYYDGDTYASDGTVTRRYGIVDLGTLSWESLSGQPYYFSRFFDNVVKVDPSVICSKYSVLGYYSSNSAILAVTDVGIIVKTNSATGNIINIHDPSYNDAATFKTAMSGVYLVYELATPTTETADSFHNPQICSPYGTEEYVDTRDVPVPVGHETEYYADPVAEIERVAVMLPVPPTVAGSYRLTCTVVGGVPAYSWTS